MSRMIKQFFNFTPTPNLHSTGLSLIMEGFMSSLYHICPTNANFQFGKTCKTCTSLGNKLLGAVYRVLTLFSDTAFMFIIAGLLLTKVFQNRHPDIHANAFIAFFSFAVVIFFTLLGIVRNLLCTRFSCHMAQPTYVLACILVVYKLAL